MSCRATTVHHQCCDPAWDSCICGAGCRHPSAFSAANVSLLGLTPCGKSCKNIKTFLRHDGDFTTSMRPPPIPAPNKPLLSSDVVPPVATGPDAVLPFRACQQGCFTHNGRGLLNLSFLVVIHSHNLPCTCCIHAKSISMQQLGHICKHQHKGALLWDCRLPLLSSREASAKANAQNSKVHSKRQMHSRGGCKDRGQAWPKVCSNTCLLFACPRRRQ